MIKKLLKPLLRMLLGAGLCAAVSLVIYTLLSAQSLFSAIIPEAGSDRYLLLDNRLSTRVVVDQRDVGLFSSRADVRIRVADGADIPLRVAMSYGPFFLSGDRRLALARWRVTSSRDIARDELHGWIDGYTGFDRSVHLASRVLDGGTTLPFGAGRLVIKNASISLSRSPQVSDLQLQVSADEGRFVMPHQHASFSGVSLKLTTLPASWSDSDERSDIPKSLARGEFEIDELRLTRRDTERRVQSITGEFDASTSDQKLSLEVFGSVGSVPVFAGTETGELEYGFLLGGIDQWRLEQALRRDAELTRTVRRTSLSDLPEPVDGYRGAPRAELWPDDLAMQQRLLALVRSGVETYLNLKLTQDDATVQVRLNTEFEHLGEGNSMMGLRNWGELLNRTIADFSFYAENELVRWEPIERGIEELNRLGLLHGDRYGPSSSVHLRSGEVEINGEAHTLRDLVGEQLTKPIPTVAALRRQRLNKLRKQTIH